MFRTSTQEYSFWPDPALTVHLLVAIDSCKDLHTADRYVILHENKIGLMGRIKRRILLWSELASGKRACVLSASSNRDPGYEMALLCQRYRNSGYYRTSLIGIYRGRRCSDRVFPATYKKFASSPRQRELNAPV